MVGDGENSIVYAKHEGQSARLILNTAIATYFSRGERKRAREREAALLSVTVQGRIILKPHNRWVAVGGGQLHSGWLPGQADILPVSSNKNS